MQDSNSSAQTLLPIKSQTKNLLVGEWKYFESIWYSSELTLQNDGTFKFHDQGCYGQNFSEGQWTNSNGIILLISFDSFKQNEQTETNKRSKTIEQQSSKRNLTEGEVEYSLVDFKEVTPSIMTGPNDTVRIYLDKIQLQLFNDTLYCIGHGKLPENAKFYRNKNNR